MATRPMSSTLSSDSNVEVVAVHVRNVTRSFGDRAVLRGIDLDIRPGEFVALLGRSGSGKSTFLRALAGLDPAVTGEIFVPERRAVGFQDARLLPWAKVLDNVVLGLGRRDSRERGERALEEVGLADHAHDWPKTLSGGEAQRAALARALVREPALLLLDEPFGALDALTRIRMHRLVAELCARHHPAVLLVTHDVDEAIVLADRVLVLTDGVISLDRSIDSTFPRPRSRFDARFAALRSDLLAELGVEDDANLDLSNLDLSDLTSPVQPSQETPR
jgi:sulfonate transport system ATP-binding protein